MQQELSQVARGKQSVSQGLQYVTATQYVTTTITCGSDGSVPSLCVLFLQVKHACASDAATAAQPNLCFQLRRNTESVLLGSPVYISLVHQEHRNSLFAITVSCHCCSLSCWTAEVSPDTKGRKGLIWMSPTTTEDTYQTPEFHFAQGASLFWFLTAKVLSKTGEGQNWGLEPISESLRVYSYILLHNHDFISLYMWLVYHVRNP